MNILKAIFGIIQILPGLITGIENIFGQKTGQKKQDVTVEMVGNVITGMELVSGKDIIDAAGFQAGLKMVIDGVVQMLNASVWHKAPELKS